MSNGSSPAIKPRPTESFTIKSTEKIFALGRKSDLKGIQNFSVLGYIISNLSEQGLYSPPISLFQLVEVMAFSDLRLVKAQF